MPSFACSSQAQQRLVAAKLLVNVAIIFGIVFVHARGFKHRVQIQRRHAEFFRYGVFR
jgi:hypothetical protein